MNENPKTRVSLILRLKTEQDAEAWREFVEIYEPFIFQLACQKGLQPADASDVTQDVLSKIVAAINRYDHQRTTGTFRGWIATIARNLVVDFLRSNSRRANATGNSDILKMIESIPAPSHETSVFDVQSQRRIFAWAAEQTKDNFRSTTWQAFWLTSVEQQPADTVATKLEISVGAVYIAKSRVLARIRKTIADTGFCLDSKNKPPGGKHE